MRKSKIEKIERRASGIAQAEKVEHEMIFENPKSGEGIRKLQSRYGLPLARFGDEIEWLGYNEPVRVDEETHTIILGERRQRRKSFEKEISELAKQYQVPSEFYESLYQKVLLGKIHSFSMSATLERDYLAAFREIVTVHTWRAIQRKPLFQFPEMAGKSSGPQWASQNRLFGP